MACGATPLPSQGFGRRPQIEKEKDRGGIWLLSSRGSEDDTRRKHGTPGAGLSCPRTLTSTPGRQCAGPSGRQGGAAAKNTATANFVTRAQPGTARPGFWQAASSPPHRRTAQSSSAKRRRAWPTIEHPIVENPFGALPPLPARPDPSPIMSWAGMSTPRCPPRLVHV